MSTKISSSNIQAGTLLSIVGPKITGIVYPGDDTAADPVGAQTIIMTGSGFNAGLVVYIGGIIVGVSSVVSSTQVTFVTPAKTAGNYALVLVNTDGGTATFVPGIQYSGTPTWSTGAGTLATVYESTVFSNTLAATSDSTVTYSVSSGTLPTGATLNAASGSISGTVPAVASSTTYNFTVNAKDGENQDTDRNFSYTINPDVVAWSSPSSGATLSGIVGTAYTQSLSATSAAGKSITYTANALPSGLSISGASITGTPSAISSISTLITATAATTGKTATRSVVWSVAATLATPFLMYTAPSTQTGSTTWTAPSTQNTIPTSTTGPYGDTASELNITTPFIATGLLAPNNTTWVMDQDWYMDMWVINKTSDATNPMVLWCAWDSAQAIGYTQMIMFYSYTNSNNLDQCGIRPASGYITVPNVTAFTKPALNTWTHYAMQYDDGTKQLSLFKGGAYITGVNIGAGGWGGKAVGSVNPLNWYAGYAMGGVWAFDNFRVGYGKRFTAGASYSTAQGVLYGTGMAG